ncbi:MAG: hypothetical protein M1486_06630 [Gammaproteobacteria bacterium]|nr:hypothetical protein [Gammaproteobacteria bacterium]
MNTRSVAAFLLKSILCAFLAIFALNASAHYGCQKYKRHHYRHVVRCHVAHRHVVRHHRHFVDTCRYRTHEHRRVVLRCVPCNVIWACGHYVPFNGYVPGRYVRLQGC